MRYKNIKTGAVIDSPCTISGGDWIIYDKDEVTQDFEKEEQKNDAIEDDEEEENQEESQGSDEVAELSKKEIIQELKALGIKFNPSANKKELYDLMMKGR
jgi:hypothetical protein|nr:MAG TPA: dimeris T4 recombination endonuclease VII [Caudoviricetes sp.]